MLFWFLWFRYILFRKDKLLRFHGIESLEFMYCNVRVPVLSPTLEHHFMIVLWCKFLHLVWLNHLWLASCFSLNWWQHLLWFHCLKSLWGVIWNFNIWSSIIVHRLAPQVISIYSFQRPTRGRWEWSLVVDCRYEAWFQIPLAVNSLQRDWR